MIIFSSVFILAVAITASFFIARKEKPETSVYLLATTLRRAPTRKIPFDKRITLLLLLVLPLASAFGANNSQIIRAQTPLNLTNGLMSIPLASSSANGYLSSGDWTTFNSKQSPITFSNLTSATSALSVTGGTSSVNGSGVSLSIATANTGQPGLLSAADWNSFNGKLTSPLTTKGDILTFNGTANVRFPACTNGNVLSYDSAQSSGLTCASVASSSITALTGDVTATGPGAAAATVAKIQGTVVGGTTGSGNVVFSASPTFTSGISTPAITVTGASNENILWATDGSGNVGANGANRPNNVYALNRVTIGNSGETSGATGALDFGNANYIKATSGSSVGLFGANVQGLSISSSTAIFGQSASKFSLLAAGDAWNGQGGSYLQSFGRDASSSYAVQRPYSILSTIKATIGSSTGNIGGALGVQIPSFYEPHSTLFVTSANSSTTIVASESGLAPGVTELWVGVGDYLQLNGLSPIARVTAVSGTTITVNSALGDGTSRAIKVISPLASFKTSDNTEQVLFDYDGQAYFANTTHMTAANVSELSASLPVQTDSSKNLVSSATFSTKITDTAATSFSASGATGTYDMTATNSNFGRISTAADTGTIQLQSNTATNNDTHGGPSILMTANDGSAANSGSLDLYAFGAGGVSTNQITFNTRSGVSATNQVGKFVNGGLLMASGKAIQMQGASSFTGGSGASSFAGPLTLSQSGTALTLSGTTNGDITRGSTHKISLTDSGGLAGSSIEFYVSINGTLTKMFTLDGSASTSNAIQFYKNVSAFPTYASGGTIDFGSGFRSVNVGQGITVGNDGSTAGNQRYLFLYGSNSQIMWNTDNSPSNIIGSNDGTSNFRPYAAIIGTYVRTPSIDYAGYDTATMTNAGSHTIANDKSFMVLHASGAIGSYTLTMPAAPRDGQEVIITADQTITTLTISANSGQTIVGAATTFVPGTTAVGNRFIYNLANTQWLPF